MFLITYHNFY